MRGGDLAGEPPRSLGPAILARPAALDHHGIELVEAEDDGEEVDLALRLRLGLLEVDQDPSAPFNYPSPLNNPLSRLKSCHLEIVLATCKRLYPKKKFTRPKVCEAVESCYGWRPKSSNSERSYGELAAYLISKALGNVEVDE